MITYQYMTLDVSSAGPDAAQKYLGSLGSEGWRLIAVDGGIAYLMKEVQK